jgi:hypothetical protein
LWQKQGNKMQNAHFGYDGEGPVSVTSKGRQVRSSGACGIRHPDVATVEGMENERKRLPPALYPLHSMERLP